MTISIKNLPGVYKEKPKKIDTIRTLYIQDFLNDFKNKYEFKIYEKSIVEKMHKEFNEFKYFLNSYGYKYLNSDETIDEFLKKELIINNDGTWMIDEINKL